MVCFSRATCSTCLCSSTYERGRALTSDEIEGPGPLQRSLNFSVTLAVTPVAHLDVHRIRRHPILAGLINEYHEVA
jgi:hypothetical protein